MSNRDIDLVIDYLTRERKKHLTQAHRIAVESTNALDYAAITNESKAAALLEKVASDVKLLERDPAEFIKRYLQERA